MKGSGGTSVDGYLCIIFGTLLGFVALSEGYVHFVGGRDGWVLSPSESYNHWTGNTRFQIDDTLVFSYPKGDSVLVVNETDYNMCNPNNPIQALHGGYSIFKLDRSGPFYFISGITNQCYKGHKMVIIVMAVRNNTPVSPASSPFPSISMPPTSSNLRPNAPPGGALSPSPSVGSAPPPVPGADVGSGIAPAPLAGEPSAGIAPASGPTGQGISIGPSSGPAAGPSMGFTPASSPGDEPPPNNDGSAAVFTSVYWVSLVFTSMIFQGVI